MQKEKKISQYRKYILKLHKHSVEYLEPYSASGSCIPLLGTCMCASEFGPEYFKTACYNIKNQYL